MSDDKSPSCSWSYVCFQPMMYYQRGFREFMELNQRLLGCGLWAVTSFGEWSHKQRTLPGCVTESIWALPVLLGVPYFIGIWRIHSSQCSETQWNIRGTHRKKGCKKSGAYPDAALVDVTCSVRKQSMTNDWRQTVYSLGPCENNFEGENALITTLRCLQCEQLAFFLFQFFSDSTCYRGLFFKNCSFKSISLYTSPASLDLHWKRSTPWWCGTLNSMHQTSVISCHYLVQDVLRHISL